MFLSSGERTSANRHGAQFLDDVNWVEPIIFRQGSGTKLAVHLCTDTSRTRLNHQKNSAILNNSVCRLFFALYNRLTLLVLL